MFLTHEDWRVQSATVNQLARPLHPWSCVTTTTTEPTFLVKLSSSLFPEESRYTLVAGIGVFLQLTSAPGCRVESVSHLSLIGRDSTPRLEPLIALRRITPSGLPAQHHYMTVDGEWSPLEPWPTGEILPFEEQTVVFCLSHEDCY